MATREESPDREDEVVLFWQTIRGNVDRGRQDLGVNSPALPKPSSNELRVDDALVPTQAMDGPLSLDPASREWLKRELDDEQVVRRAEWRGRPDRDGDCQVVVD